MNARDVLNRMFKGKGYRIERTMPAVLRNDARFEVNTDFLIMHEIFRNKGQFTFVQIGANDGVSRSDDLFRYIQKFDATGIMVEPQPVLFKQLSENFQEFPNVQLVNKAIHQSERSMQLYCLDPESLKGKDDLPHWAVTNGIASFDREHVIKHAERIGLDGSDIHSESVECITLNELLKLVDKSPDILKIDTEGYDYEVISMLDLSLCTPSIIRFEHLHMLDQQYESTIRRLVDAGYKFLADKMNTTAYKCKESV